jgi:hypothetical protein
MRERVAYFPLMQSIYAFMCLSTCLFKNLSDFRVTDYSHVATKGFHTSVNLFLNKTCLRTPEV